MLFVYAAADAPLWRADKTRDAAMRLICYARFDYST